MVSTAAVDTPTRTRTAAPTGLLFGAAVFVVLGLGPQYMSAKLLSLVTTALVLAIVSYGVDLVHGTTRYLSLAHVGVWAVAAYVFVGMQVHLQWTILPSALAALAAAVVLGALVAAFIFRTSGFYFAILTLAISEAVRLTLTNLTDLTGGQAGTFLPGAALFGLDLTKPTNTFYLALVVCAFTVVFVSLIVRSGFGLKCRAIGQSEPFAASLGIDLYRTKVAVFVLSVVPVGLAGAVFTIQTLAITPELFDVNKSLATVLVVILGGSGHRYGALVGALFYIVVPAYLPLSPAITEAGMGLLLIAVVAVGRRGIAPTLETGWKRLVERVRKR